MRFPHSTRLQESLQTINTVHTCELWAKARAKVTLTFHSSAGGNRALQCTLELLRLLKEKETNALNPSRSPKGPRPVAGLCWIESDVTDAGIDWSSEIASNEASISPSGVIHYAVKFQFLPCQCNYGPSVGALRVLLAFNFAK